MPPSAKLLAAFMAMSLLAWFIIARVHLIPWLNRKTQREALLVVVMPHMFRTIGAMAVFPGIGAAPAAWGVPLAIGDTVTSGLAMVSMVALHRSWRHANKVVWLFNVFGLLDMLHNGYNSVVLQVAPTLGPIGYVVAFGVPGMFVFHLLVFRELLRHSPVAPAAAPAS